MTRGKSAAPASEPRSAITRLLNTVEFLGNLLPHPVTLFALLALLIVLLSGVLAAYGVSVPDPRPEGASGRAEDGIIRVISLLDAEGLRRIVMGLVTNFTSFVPLGTVLVAMLGVGIAERSGLLTAAIKALVLGAPKNLVTVVIVFAAVMSNTASEMGYVVVIPLAAAIFHALGRHPLAGLAAAFAGVSGGYSANLLIGTVDPLLAGITQEAARLIALRSPTATDLRLVLTVIKISASLERVGDYAKNIAKRSNVLAHMPVIEGAGMALRRMSSTVEKMLKDALDSYVHRDAALASDVRARDLEVDQMYNALFREFLTHMMEDPRNITACMHLHFIAKNVERMGDLATAIAEQVIYLVTGDLPDDSRPKDNRVPDLGADLPTGR